MASTVKDRLNQTGLQDAAVRKLSAGNLGGVDATEQSTFNPFESVNALLPQSAPTIPAPTVDPNTALKDFSFNPKYAAVDQGLRRQVVDSGEQRNYDLTRTDQEYTAGVEEAGRTHKTAAQRLMERMASQGIFHSGINVAEQGDLETSYNRYLGGLANNRAMRRTDIERGYGKTIGDIAAQRESLYGQQVAEEEAIRLENERQAAAAEAARQEAARQAELQRQLAEQQQAALAAIAAQPRQTFPSVALPSIGAPGVDLPNFYSPNPVDQDAILNYINTNNDLNWLHRMNELNNPIVEIPGAQVNPAMPPHLAEAVKRRIQIINDANKATQKTTGNFLTGGRF